MTSRGRTALFAVAPLPFVAWSAFRLLSGELRWDFVAFLIVPPVLAWCGERTRRLFVGLYPLGLVGLMYDAMRFVKDVGVSPERVHLCDLRALESRLFGFGVGGAGSGATLHDWLQAHAWFPLDVFFAIPYGTFLFASIGCVVYLWRRDFETARRFGWAYFLVNLVGFATYHVVPAAPPWYFHAHGCAVDMAARSSEGPNLARVDAWLGVPYFHGMYGRAADVYGAVPSLHVAYPLLILLFGWPHFGVATRIFGMIFFASMCVAAVYLDHHWIVDVVLGLAYGAAAYAALEYAPSVFRARMRAGAASPVAVEPAS